MKPSTVSLSKLAASLGLIAILLLAARARAADDACQAGLQAPSELSLSLSLKNDQTVFRQGEIITLVLRYASTKEGKYIWNSRSYDRSGRLGETESFCLNPYTGPDPLGDYYKSQVLLMGGGLYSELELGSSPRTIERDLNEWAPLPPGWYTLSVIGSRVSIGKEGNSKSWDHKPISLRSNAVTFQVITADPTWQSEQLSAAAQLLDGKNATGDEKDHARRILRFLGTEDSMKEAVRRFAATSDDQSPWEFEAAIWSSPNRQDAIREMRSALETSNGKINRYFVSSLVQLEMQSDPEARYSPNYRDPKLEMRETDRYLGEMNRRVDAYKAQYGVSK